MMVDFDITAKSPFILVVSRSRTHNTEIIMLEGDVYHCKEKSDVMYSAREITLQEISGELEIRAHRATNHGVKELRRI